MLEIDSLVTAYGLRGVQAENADIQQLNAEAENGSTDAIYNLAVCYRDAVKVVQDLEKSFYLLKQLSDYDKDALYLLAEYYRFGYGVEQDIELYWTLLVKYISDYGEILTDTVDRFAYAQAIEDQNIMAAIDIYTRLATEDCFLPAKSQLAILYISHEEVLDYQKTFRWASEAADENDSIAEYLLGLLYMEGLGVQQDYAMAADWFSKAAEQGVAAAQNNLGNCFLKGQGVPQYHTMAAYWYTQGAEQGLASAQYNIGSMYYHGLGVLQDYEKSASWIAKSAEQGYMPAQMSLFGMYAEGKGVPQNDEKAVYWLTKAAEQGNRDAQKVLDLLS